MAIFFRLPDGTVIPIIAGGGPPVSPPVTPPVSPPPPSIPGDFGASAGIKGSWYVSGADMIYIANDGHAWGGAGVAQVSPAGAKPGSVWVDTEGLHYIDNVGVDRLLDRTTIGAKPAGAIPGSVWVDTSGRTGGKQLEWIGAANDGYWWNGF